MDIGSGDWLSALPRPSFVSSLGLGASNAGANSRRSQARVTPGAIRYVIDAQSSVRHQGLQFDATMMARYD